MGELLQVLRHLITHGPARNPSELERLLGLVDQTEQRLAAAEQPPEQPPEQAPAPGSVPPAPVTTPTQPPGGAL